MKLWKSAICEVTKGTCFSFTFNKDLCLYPVSKLPEMRSPLSSFTWPTFSEYVQKPPLWCHKERWQLCRVDKSTSSPMFIWLLRTALFAFISHLPNTLKVQQSFSFIGKGFFFQMAANRRLNVLVSVDLGGLTEVLDENEHMRMNRTWKLNCGGLELFSFSFPQLGSAVGCTFWKIYEYTQRIQQVKWKSVYKYKESVRSPKAKCVLWHCKLGQRMCCVNLKMLL